MNIVVDDAVFVEQPTGMLVWQVTYTVDGAVVSHVFPQSVFSWRVAEYDLNPADVDALIEMVLYEAHMVQDPDHPMSLGHAPTVDEARAHYLQQIAAVKGAGAVTDRRRRKTEKRLIDPTKIKGRIIADNADTVATPLAMLKQHITINPEHVAVMRRAVSRNRALAAQR